MPRYYMRYPEALYFLKFLTNNSYGTQHTSGKELNFCIQGETSYIVIFSTCQFAIPTSYKQKLRKQV